MRSAAPVGQALTQAAPPFKSLQYVVLDRFFDHRRVFCLRGADARLTRAEPE